MIETPGEDKQLTGIGEKKVQSLPEMGGSRKGIEEIGKNSNLFTFLSTNIPYNPSTGELRINSFQR